MTAPAVAAAAAVRAPFTGRARRELLFCVLGLLLSLALPVVGFGGWSATCTTARRSGWPGWP